MEKLFEKKFFRLLILVVIFGVIINMGYEKFRIEGESMVSTYGDGETLLVHKTSYKFNTPERGDVVVFYDFADNEFLVKRIVGLPGEKIEIIDGNIYVDEILWKDQFSDLKPAALLVGPDENPLKNWETGENVYENDNIEYKRLAVNEYWVIGDNRQESWYGIIYGEEIIGKVKH